MSQEAITELKKKQDSQEFKIQSMEKTIDVLFPPLIEQLKEVSSNLAANTQAITKSTMAQEHLSKDVQELKSSSAEKWKEINAIKVTQSANQIVINAVKGIGMKIFASTITIVVAAIGAAIVVIKSVS